MTTSSESDLPSDREYVIRISNYVPRYVLLLEDVSPAGTAAGDQDAKYDAVIRMTTPRVRAPLNGRSLSQFLHDATGRGTPLEQHFLNNTEFHIICRSVPGFFDHGFVAHYSRLSHRLELRTKINLPEDLFGNAIPGEGSFLVGLSTALNQIPSPPPQTSVMRLNHPVQQFSFPKINRAGVLERNLEVGQAIASLAYAAAALGWEVRLLGPSFGKEALQRLMGLRSETDLANERPVAALLVFPALLADPVDGADMHVSELRAKIQELFNDELQWSGGPHVVHAPFEQLGPLEQDDGDDILNLNMMKPEFIAGDFIDAPAGATLRQLLNTRCITEAADFDRDYTVGPENFKQFVLRCCPSVAAASSRCFPHGVLPWIPEVNAFFFVNRVEGLELGVNSQPNCMKSFDQYLRACPSHIKRQLRKSAFFVVMVAPSKSNSRGSVDYKHMWEAGFLGEILSVEAQAQGLSASRVYSPNNDFGFWSDILDKKKVKVVCVYAVGKLHSSESIIPKLHTFLKQFSSCFSLFEKLLFLRS